MGRARRCSDTRLLLAGLASSGQLRWKRHDRRGHHARGRRGRGPPRSPALMLAAAVILVAFLLLMAARVL